MLFAALAGFITAAAEPGPRPRARELGIAALIGGTPGRFDAITDVPGVEVGHTTLVEAERVRTGVTIIHPRGRAQTNDPVFAGWNMLNGNGEMTGTAWIEESGYLEGPVGITNTYSVGVVRDSITRWQVANPGFELWGLPVVAETYDGGLNDITGFHVKEQHVLAALDGAHGGPVEEGNVGGGTGMICHRFKGGIGTASRVLPPAAGGYTVGVLVQCNYGVRPLLSVAGVPVGQEIADQLPCLVGDAPSTRGVTLRCDQAARNHAASDDIEMGSIIVIVATDAPLLPHQLKRLTRRVPLGVGRMGGMGGNTSGDIFLAFSTANPGLYAQKGSAPAQQLANDAINPLFDATVQATEEAITNALLAARTMTANGLRVYELPQDRLLQALRKYRRLP
ncbi:MAG: P1 family peptidase [Steroidobacteraceae bacterium]